MLNLSINSAKQTVMKILMLVISMETENIALMLWVIVFEAKVVIMLFHQIVRTRQRLWFGSILHVCGCILLNARVWPKYVCQLGNFLDNQSDQTYDVIVTAQKR